MSDEYRVLITASGSKGVPSLIRDLRNSNERFHIVTADINAEALGNLFADNWYIVPPWDNDKYIQSILQIVEKEGIGYIIPNDGPIGLLKLSELSGRNDKLKIAVTKNREHLFTVINKSRLYNFLRLKGMQEYAPKFSTVSDTHSLIKTIKEFGYPQEEVAIKPAISEGSRGFWIIRNRERNIFEDKGNNRYLTCKELEFHLMYMNKIPEVLVMEYLPGEEYSIDVLVNQERKIEYIVPRTRDEVSEGISVKGVVKKNAEVEDLVVNILHELELIYAINIQIKYSKEGIPKIIEINPRVSGTMTFCAGAGVNFHYCLILIMAGKSLPKSGIKYGTRMYRYYAEKYIYE